MWKSCKCHQLVPYRLLAGHLLLLSNALQREIQTVGFPSSPDALGGALVGEEDQSFLLQSIM